MVCLSFRDDAVALVEALVVLDAAAVEAVAGIDAGVGVCARGLLAELLQLVVVDKGVREVRVGDVHLAHVGTDEVGVSKHSPAHVAASQEGVVKHSKARVDVGEVCVVEESAAEDGSAHVRAVQVSVLQRGLGKESLRQVLPSCDNKSNQHRPSQQFKERNEACGCGNGNMIVMRVMWLPSPPFRGVLMPSGTLTVRNLSLSLSLSLSILRKGNGDVCSNLMRKIKLVAVGLRLLDYQGGPRLGDFKGDNRRLPPII